MGDRESGRTPEQLLDDLRAEAAALRARCALLQAAAERTVGVLGVSRDITEQSQAEETLERSRRIFAGVFENALEGMLLIDDSARFVEGNPAICQLLGYSREELLALTAWDVTPAPNRERVRDLVGALISTGTLSGEYTLLCKGGATREVEYRCVANIVPGLHLVVDRDITERKQAERELKDRHHLLQAVLEGIGDAIYVKGLDGCYVMINSAGARIIDRPVPEVIGRDDRFFFDPETAQRIMEIDRRVMESEKRSTDELTTTLAGVSRTFVNSKVRFRDADGAVIGVLGISREISESKALETERDRLLDRLRLQIDRLPLAYILSDENHRVIDWNPAAETMFGYSKAEILGESAIELIVPQPVDRELAEVIRRIEAGDMQANTINENCTKDGRIITCQWFNTPLINEHGEFTGVISVAQDITERRRAEEETRVLNSVMENAVDGIARMDAAGRYTSVNRAYGDILGFRAEELLGAHWLSTVHSIDHEKAKAAYEHMLNTGKAEVELLGLRKDKSVFWRQTVMIKARDHHPEWIGHFSFMTDITERKEVEEALRGSAERLHALSRRVVEVQEQERRRIARELHDEIGQVLSAISVNLQRLEVDSPAAAHPRIEESIQIINQAVQQVRSLSLDLRPSMLDDLGLAATLRWLVDRQTQRSGLAPHFSVESSGAPLPADIATACFRVAQEALTNVTRHAQAKEVWVELKQDEEQVRLLVRDDGVGFDPDAAQARARRGESIGLLAIQERVELLGGRAEVESQPGHGTSIRIRFPLSSSASSDPPKEGGEQ